MLLPLLALQLAGAAPGVIAVRAGSAEGTVPLLETNAGAALPLDRFAPTIPVTIRATPEGRYAVTVPGVEIEFTSQVPFARVGNAVIPLAAAPFVSEGRLYVPLQVVSELLPMLVPSRLRYNPVRGELVLLDGSPPVGGVVVATGASPGKPASPAPPNRRPHRRLVVVDAGHGGPDAGMHGPIGSRIQIHEKDITLAVAKKLETALRARDVDVVMTRTTDTLIALSDRGRIANEKHGDVFVSVHVYAANPNWRQPAEARGFETYFLAEARTEDDKRVEEMENEAVRFETGAAAAKNDPLNFVINDMAQNEHLRESSELATLIQRRLGEMHPGPSRGVKQAGFRVLVTAFMPAVLVEIGFGTNPEEARYISSPTRQKALAEAIADATVQYLEHYERRVAAPAP